MTDLSSPSMPAGQSIHPLVELIGFRLSTATLLLHQAIADRLGVNPTDLKCYSILRQTGPITAGDLAERTHLTTGAITGVIDRLEHARLVQRSRDPNDRRRIVLECIYDAEREQVIAELYGPLGREVNDLVAQYAAADQALLLDFLSRAIAVLEAETERLRHSAPSH